MNSHFTEIALKATGASDIYKIEKIQSLWSGYGDIIRYGLKGSDLSSIVIKHVKLPRGGRHVLGWNSNLSHERKVKSYEVETTWYGKYSTLCDENCRIPHCLAFESKNDEVLIILEDLDAAGYPNRKRSLSKSQIDACLKWLANFHATFLGIKPEGLWKTGTYWHLETRPEELEVLNDKPLKNAASKIDRILNECKYQTIVHGDAKLANFNFSSDGRKVAAVDFQYVGGGIGMKDLAYFIGSVYYEEDCENITSELLDIYFNELTNVLSIKNKTVNPKDVESEWRQLYPVAWTDFHRFMKGWSPGHWDKNSYSERVARDVIKSL